MSASKLSEIMLDIEELKRVEKTVVRPKVKDIISLGIRKLETEAVKLREAEGPQAQNVSSQPRPSATTKCYDVKITNYAWDQSDKFVKLFVFLNNVHSLSSDAVTCNFKTKSVELIIKGLENRNYTLTILNLLENIDVTKSYWKVKTDNVVVFLVKEAQSKVWAHLTRSEMKSKELKSPASSIDPEADPSDGLMTLMKKMYEEGDDDMKRTIVKAWTESREKSNVVGRDKSNPLM